MASPKDFLLFPIDSVFNKWDFERVAVNVMIILSRTGNTFRQLSWEEYKAERLKDLEFSEIEKPLFEKVLPFCVSDKQAATFCSKWSQILNGG